MPEHRVARQLVLPVPRDEVWEALTDPELLGAWLGADVEFDPRPGGAASFVPDRGPARDGRVAEVTPGERLSFDWWSRGVEDAATRVEFTLVEDEDADAESRRTTLTVTETGFEASADQVVHDLAWGMTMARAPQALAAAVA